MKKRNSVLGSKRRSRLAAGLGGMAIGVASVAATAQVADFVVDYSASTAELNVARIYLQFSNPNYRLLNLDSNCQALDPLGFFQHPFGSDRAPSAGAIFADPLAALDSFVTIGLAVGTPDDGTAFDPGWNSLLFNTAGRLQGGWYCIPSPNGQGNAGPDGRVLVAQITTFQGVNPGFMGELEAFWQALPQGTVVQHSSINISTPLDLQSAGAVSNADAENPLTVNYTVRNFFDAPLTFALDAAMTIGGLGPRLDDPANLVTPTIGPGVTGNYSRQFNPSSPIIAGPYRREYTVRWLNPNGTLGAPFRIVREPNVAVVHTRPQFGVTVIVENSAPGVPSIFSAIAGRIPTMKQLFFDPQTRSWTSPQGSTPTPTDELLLSFNAPGLNGLQPSTSFGAASAAAEALTAALLDPKLPPSLAGLDLLASGVHLIGTDRGAVVVSQVARRLALRNVTIDHVTHAAPRPLDGTGGNPDHRDPPVRVWNNTNWADHYYFSGSGSAQQQLGGAFNQLLPVGNWTGHLWYLDTAHLTPINPQRIAMYGPEGGWNQGYFWSEVIGGPDMFPRPAASPGASFPDAVNAGPMPTVLFNGDFQLGYNMIAGWYGSGGNATTTTTWASDGFSHFLRLGPQPYLAALRHNLFWLGENVHSLQFKTRLSHQGFLTDQLRIFLTGQNGEHFTLFQGVPPMIAPAPTGNRDPGPPTSSFPIEIGPEWISMVVTIPHELRGRAYTLTAEIIPAGALDCHIDVDDLVFVSTPTIVVGDINGDGVVSSADLGILLGSWGSPGCGGSAPCPADLNGDGSVGPADLGILLGNWP